MHGYMRPFVPRGEPRFHFGSVTAAVLGLSCVCSLLAHSTRGTGIDVCVVSSAERTIHGGYEDPSCSLCTRHARYMRSVKRVKAKLRHKGCNV